MVVLTFYFSVTGERDGGDHKRVFVPLEAWSVYEGCKLRGGGNWKLDVECR